MSKQIQVGMKFTADTSQAQNAINSLKQNLQQLAYGSKPIGVDSASFEQASRAAKELSYHLNQAYNSQTGKLDLSKLDASLKSSKTSLSQLTQSFAGAGDAGKQAFVGLAQSIANAEQPAIRLNGFLGDMWTTLKNTARWQISANLLQGLTGGVQKAYRYAQDLNESLNNIRIVTGYSTDKMADFAVEANKAAKALSTTTTAYTEASLIYFQQGLSGSDVTDRVETTVKLANVSRQSAEEVSDQLTAIWNNFYDGSRSLESYADTLTALGAATASSTEEISTGLEKFAAIADTVGLSYDYAAAALATVTATTRQSADTVGTAFRTLFGRLQDLELGETLEDGTDLGKYSKALAAVGVQIKDVSGEMKDMDQILDDLGARWDKLDKATQTALAQTVGGTRQYAQLIAFMDNWSFFQQNLGVAQGSEGTLQEQADIYAESWEAAKDRVKASAESIYQSIIDDKFFIGFNNTLADLLSGVGKFFKEIGGGKTLVIGLLTLAADIMSTKIQPMVENLVRNIKVLAGGSAKYYQDMANSNSEMIESRINDPKWNFNDDQKNDLRNAERLATMRARLATSENLSDSEKRQAEIEVQMLEMSIAKSKEELAIWEQKKQLVEQTGDAVTSAEEKVNNTLEEQINLEKEAKAALQERINNLQTELNLANQRNNVARRSAISAVMRDVNYESVISAKNTLSTLTTKDINGQNVQRYDQNFLNGLEQQANQVAASVQMTIKKAFVLGKEEAVGLADIIRNSFNSIMPEGSTTPFDEAQARLQMLKASLGDLNKYPQSLRDAFNDAFNAKNAKALEQALSNIQDRMNALKDTDIKITKLKDLKDFGISQSAIDALDKYKKALEDVNNAQKKLSDEMAKDAGKTAELEKAYTKLQGNVEKLSVKELESIKTELQEANASKTIITAIDQLIKKKQNLLEVTEQADKAGQDFKNTNEQINNTVNGFNPTHILTGMEALSKTAAGAGAFAMTVNSIKGVVQTLNSEDASGIEKWTSAFMAFSFAIPSVTRGISNFKDLLSPGIEAIRAYKNGLNITKESADFINATQANLNLLKEEGQLKGAITQIQKEENSEKTKASGITRLRNLLKKTELTQEQQDIVVKEIQNGATLEQAKATALANAETQKQTLSLWEMVTAEYAALGPILAIVAALGLLAGAIYLIYKNSPQGKIKALEKELEKLNEQLDENKQRVEDVKSAFDDYNSIVEKLNSCTKGTDEWNEALEETQNKVKELIGLYPELSDYLKLSDKGVWVISQEGIDTLEKSTKMDQFITESAIRSNKIETANLRNVVSKNDLKEFSVLLERSGQTRSVGSIFTDEQLDEIANIAGSIEREEAIKKVISSFESSGEQVSYNLEALSQFFTDYHTALQENNRLISAQNNILAQEALEDNNNVQDSRFMKDIYEQSGKQYQIEYDKAFEEQNKKGLNELKEDFFESTGKRVYQDNKGNMYYLNAEGDQQSLSREQMVAATAETKADYGLDSWGDQVAKTFDSLSDQQANIYEAIKKGDLTSLTEEELNSLSENQARIIKDINDKLDESFDIDQNIIDVQQLIDDIDVQSKINELQTAINSVDMAQLNTLISEKNIGDIFKKEEYENIIAIAGQQAEQYFETMADGTHRLTISGEQFLNNVKAGTQGSIKNTINTYKNFDATYSRKTLSSVYNEDGSVSEGRVSALTQIYKDKGLIPEETSLEKSRELILQLAKTDLPTLAESYLKTASSIDELNSLWVESFSLIGAENLSYEAYADALINLAKQYDNTVQEIEAYNKALSGNNEEEILAAEANLELATRAGELGKQYNLEAEEIESYAKRLKDSEEIQEQANGNAKLAAKIAADMAAANMRLDRGLTNLNKNLDDYKKKLKESNKGTADWSKTMDALKNDLADVLNFASGDLISDEFAEATLNSEDFKKALDGDIDALLRIKAEAADDIIAHLDIDDNKMMAVEGYWNNIKSMIQDDEIMAPGVDQTKLINAFNQMIHAGNMTKEQIEAAMAGLNIGANLIVDYNEVTHDVPQTITEESTQYAGKTTVWAPGEDGKWGPQELPLIRKITTTYSGKPVPVTEYVPTYKIEGTTGPNGVTTGITRLPAPSISKSATTSGAKSGSGGGGGGSSKKKSLSDEKKRYHPVDRSIKTVTNELDKVKEATDRAYGTDKLQGMIQQQQLLTEQLELESQKLEEIGKYLDEDKKKLDQYGASYDQDGNIANYDELFTRQFAKYESGAWSDDDWEAFKKAIDQYEETLDLMQEETEKKADLTREYLDSKLEAIEYKVEVQIEVDERDIKLIDYYLSKIEDKAFNAAESIALINKKIDEFTSENDTNLQGFKETLEQAGASVQDIEDILNGKIDANALAKKLNLTEQQKEDLDGYADSLLEINEALFEANQAVKDKLTEAFEEFEEELDDVIAKFDHFDSILSSMRDIGEILNLSDSTMALIDQTQVDNAINKVAATKSKLDDIERARADTMQKLEQARAEGNQAAIDGFEESLRQIEESYAQTEEDLMSSWYDALQANLDAFQANVEKSLKVFGQAANAFKDLETLQDAREKNKNEEDRFLPDYEKAYRLSKLQRDLEKQMDELNDPAAKAKLLEIQEKITEAQADGVQMSEYEMEYLQKQYDLKLAQIALEDKQNAKTQVRLRRDSEGNLGYVYTANEKEVDEAAQKYEDTLFELQQMTDDYLDEMQDRIISDRVAMSQEIAALDRSLFESEEEYEAAIKRISDYYMADIEYSLNQIDIAIGNNQEIYEGDVGNYEDATGRKINANKDLVLDFNQTFLSENSGSVGETIETTSKYYEDLASNWDETVKNIKKYNDQYVLNNQAACGAAGYDMGQLSQTFGEKAGEIKTKSDEVAGSIQSIGDKAVAAFGGALDNANDFWIKYQPLADSIISQNEAIAESWNKITQAIIDQELEEAKRREQQTSQQTEDTSQGNPDKTDGNGNGPNDKVPVQPASYSYSTYEPYSDSEHIIINHYTDGSTKTGQYQAHNIVNFTWEQVSGTSVYRLSGKCSLCGQVVKGKKKYSTVEGIKEHYNSLKGSQSLIYNALKQGTFDTGGYTGEWGDSSGKLAILHQKELVLNKEDTKNFLDSVNILRNITSTIDLHALSSSMGLRDISAAVIGQHSQDLVQHVEINASFPGVQDHNEIELAISNLINDAAQYVGRKN